MREQIIQRALPLYWAFMPDVSVIDFPAIESWQWKLCWDLATYIEGERAT